MRLNVSNWCAMGPLCLSLAACGAPPLPAAATPSPESPPPAPVVVETPALAPAPSPEPVHAAPPPPPEPTASELCERVCATMDMGCKGRAAQVCRVNCEDHVKTAERCPVEVSAALLCQDQADDRLPCQNVAAESCVAQFTALADCRSGKNAPVERAATAIAPASGLEGPAGWARVDDAELGVSLILPAGAQVTNTTAGRRLSSEEAGVLYFVEALPPSAAAPTDRTILKSALDYLGFDCQKKLKLSSRFEKDGIIHVRLDTICKDGTEWAGMLRAFPGKTLVTTSRFTTGPGKPAALDDFLYGFRRLR